MQTECIPDLLGFQPVEGAEGLGLFQQHSVV